MITIGKRYKIGLYYVTVIAIQGDNVICLDNADNRISYTKAEFVELVGLHNL